MPTMQIPSTQAPSGGAPYHPREFGATGSPTLVKKTGLLGVIMLIATVYVSLVVLLVCSPFVLLGLAEFVSTTPTSYRVRWIRDDD